MVIVTAVAVCWLFLSWRSSHYVVKQFRCLVVTVKALSSAEQMFSSISPTQAVIGSCLSSWQPLHYDIYMCLNLTYVCMQIFEAFPPTLISFYIITSLRLTGGNDY